MKNEIREEYYKVLDTCKHALCMIGVRGKKSIERLLNCILALQDEEMTPQKVSLIINTLENITVGGTESMQLMLDVMTLLEQVRDGTFDVSQLEDSQQIDGEPDTEG